MLGQDTGILGTQIARPVVPASVDVIDASLPTWTISDGSKVDYDDTVADRVYIEGGATTTTVQTGTKSTQSYMGLVVVKPHCPQPGGAGDTGTSCYLSRKLDGGTEHICGLYVERSVNADNWIIPTVGSGVDTGIAYGTETDAIEVYLDVSTAGYLTVYKDFGHEPSVIDTSFVPRTSTGEQQSQIAVFRRDGVDAQLTFLQHAAFYW